MTLLPRSQAIWGKTRSYSSPMRAASQPSSQRQLETHFFQAVCITGHELSGAEHFGSSTGKHSTVFLTCENLHLYQCSFSHLEC